MKLCAVSESLGNLPFKEAAKASADLGLEALEIGMGNWSAAPHANLQSLLESKGKRQEFLSVLEQNGLSLAALNCSGNQLHPVDGERQSKVVFDTVRVAELLPIISSVFRADLSEPRLQSWSTLTCRAQRRLQKRLRRPPRWPISDRPWTEKTSVRSLSLPLVFFTKRCCSRF